MATVDRDTLRASLAAAVAAADPPLPGRLGQDDDAATDLVTLAAALADEAGEFLNAAVAAARAANVSWAGIGGALDVSRQAAQQRFTGALSPEWPVYAAEVDTPAEAWRLSPVTVATEMAELDGLGRQGWHSVGCGGTYHDVVPSDRQWEHARVTVFGDQPASGDGWVRVGMWFPFVYYARETKKKAVKE